MLGGFNIILFIHSVLMFTFYNEYTCLFNSYWKRLWRWITSESLTNDEVNKLLSNKDVIESLKLGLASYKPSKPNTFSQLQSKISDQTKLLSIIQTLQNYMVN